MPPRMPAVGTPGTCVAHAGPHVATLASTMAQLFGSSPWRQLYLRSRIHTAPPSVHKAPAVQC